MDSRNEKPVDNDGEQAASDTTVEAALTKPQMPSYPDGGRRAWLVVLGATIITGCSFGYTSSFGVYQAYYQENQLRDRSASDISWIGSLQLCFMFGGGFIAGPLFDRYGARIVMIPGSIGYALSVIFTSLCKTYWQFMLAQGIFGGICNGFLFSPAMAAVGHYFFHKRGAAMGLVAVGSAVGGVIFPIVLEHSFYSKIGFGWGVRATGLVMLVLMGIACALIKERLPPRKGRIFAPEALKQTSYMAAVFGIFLLIWGVYVIFFFVSEYAITELHMSTSLAFYVLSIINGASLFGRLFFGSMGDKLGLMNLISFVGVVNGILIFCWTKTTNNAGLIVWSFMFGFFSGGIFALFPATLAHITPKPQFIGTYMGQSMAAFAVAGLTGSPIVGAIVTNYGYFNASIFGGLSMLLGSVLVLVARNAHQSDWTIKA